ncbi:5-bromo-4-chloroindolyl phosphate hydrolysis family protein [Dichelobacter nodosus]|uniref:Hypothetical membrane protein n=1 Tax=Dichelobacter nodosus (strain VCS1703A) TaxID=246195 RepID=A5EVA5_DICNV|nr:5-bromo-4-chloroindolyl phosphate hydrolysis family protein [Dichelobacter nodosus]ABQ14015.1 hypothetical membrane protein [Dichelobacter nodosus VCS1703A]AXM45505.1 hypothetical protein DYQ38_03150 [Dichelobacter nodosus]KNZ39867.1 hypothetical protein AKG33_01650 [Dichelobacter nodosus]TGA66699.1 hypothetical protein E5E99_00755 [Dichelobacter nodosus]
MIDFAHIQHVLRLKLLAIRGAALYILQFPLWLAFFAGIMQNDWRKMTAAILALACFLTSARFTRHYFLQKRRNLLNNQAQLIDDKRYIALFLLCLGVLIITFSLRSLGIIGMTFLTALSGYGYRFSYFDDEKITALEPETDISPDALTPTLRKMLQETDKHLVFLTQRAQQLKQYPDDFLLGWKMNAVSSDARQIAQLSSASADHVRRSRTFFVVQLPELVKISEDYLNLSVDQRGLQRKKFMMVLEQLEHSFKEQSMQLIQQKNEQLDVRMDVLHQQLHSNHRKKDDK